MTQINKTFEIEYRHLSEGDYDALYETGMEAFSDYLIPVNLTVDQFRNNLAQNGVDLSHSVGAFCEDELVGYALFSIGLWDKVLTAYNAGTGVVPKFRNMRVGKGMFEFGIPKLREKGAGQILLEVIENNINAVRLYQNLGFEFSRRLLLFEHKNLTARPSDSSVSIRELTNPKWSSLKKFWDSSPSWQFSCEAFDRAPFPKVVLGAFFDDKCVGYGIVFKRSGTVAQLAVDRNHRKKGIGTAIFNELAPLVHTGKSVKFTNLDASLTSLTSFIAGMDFKQTLVQIEMIKAL